MCLLAVLWRVADDAPLIVAANREEAYARGGTPPQLVGDEPRFIGGLDPVAGGTWLGVNAHGLLVAVTNGAKDKHPPQPRSRGLLVRDLLGRPSATEAVQVAARELDGHRYAGCNLLIADLKSAYVIHALDWLRVLPLPPGAHVLTRGTVNNAADPRIAFALDWIHQRGPLDSKEWLEALKQLCGQDGSDGRPPICLVGERGGTVSSSLLALREPLERSRYWHSQGAPNRVPYENYSHLFQQLA